MIKFVRNKPKQSLRSVRKMTCQVKAPLFKCRLCGKLVKVTRWRKHLAYQHNIGELPKFVDYFCNETKKLCRCKICSKIIQDHDWRGHLAHSHHIDENLKFRDYYISPYQSTRQVGKKWHNPDYKSVEKDWYCGAVFNGLPKVSLIYNAVCTN